MRSRRSPVVKHKNPVNACGRKQEFYTFFFFFSSGSGLNLPHYTTVRSWVQILGEFFQIILIVFLNEAAVKFDRKQVHPPSPPPPPKKK